MCADTCRRAWCFDGCAPNAAASSLNVRSPLEAPRVAKRTGLNYNEETVTEGLLLDLQVNFPGDVLIVPFTKRREARIGADWAWAFVGPAATV